ncbi:MAG TPA: hypothetical protein VMG12_01905 [Polyangiaceae bacterium]|nr:hypothetical protein [Polyangiaceae bacterium]
MQPATVSCFPRLISSCSALLSLTLAIACGSSEVEGNDSEPMPTASNGGSASAPNPTASAGSGGSSGSNGGQTSSMNPPAGAGTQNTPATPSEDNPAAVDGDVGAACAALDTSDACGACVCEECSSELDTCANTPGCPEILACVRENDCSGTDCFCGDTLLARCFAGNGNGPCKDVVLAAPGGREPTLNDPSGGPASDAALAVGECADDDDTCSDVCDVGL